MLNALAATRAACGRTAEALSAHDEALARATEGDHRQWRADTHAGIGAVHATLGDRASARAHWRQALGHYEALGLPQAAEMRRRLTDD
ncbi:tetratricopeptide repeat protein [Streptomyces sp. B6B3]|uniref:tetratricopeptide repeat protein n=1 Tax=Streptomyces sp. B6B3 TaxID=3153570 RepID=UPI00325E078E